MRSAGAEQPVVAWKALQRGWSEGAALFGLGYWPTGNGRSPWTRQSRSRSRNGKSGRPSSVEGQPGSGWCGWAVDCGVRGQPFGQPLQALEPAVVRELLSSAGIAGRYSQGEWWDATVGDSNGC